MSARFWAPEKAGVRLPLLNLSPFVRGSPENAWVRYHFRSPLGLQEGTGRVANSDFVSLCLGAP